MRTRTAFGEEEKPAAERGHYLHPDVFGQPEPCRSGHKIGSKRLGENASGSAIIHTKLRISHAA